MTLAEIKALNDSVIRQKTLANSITTDDVADRLDDLADFTSDNIGAASAAGSTGEIQFNDGGAFGASANLTYVEDQGLVFDSPFTTPATVGNHYYDFIVAKPIDTSATQSDFIMTRWSYDNTGAAQLIVPRNEGLMMGFNLNSGGGPREAGKPSLGLSWESNYLPDYSTRYVELHKFYIPTVTAGGLTAATQVRLESYTINTATNNIDYYKRVGKEYNKVPGTEVQYFLVQPGTLSTKDATGNVEIKLELAYQIDYGGTKNVAYVATVGADVLVFQGAPVIDFSNNVITKAGLYNVVLYGDQSSVSLSANSSAQNFNVGGFGVQSLNVNNNNIANNQYYNGSVWKYREDGYASLINFYNGTINFYTASSGSAAGTVTNIPVLTISNNGSVGINTATPNASAILDLTSTTQGFLGPRGTTTQKNAISSPSEGLQFFDLTTHEPYYYNGSAWTSMLGSGGSPGGSNTQIQFNNSGAFGASADLAWNETTKRLTIKKDLVIGAVTPSTWDTYSGVFDSGTNAIIFGSSGDLHITSNAVGLGSWTYYANGPAVNQYMYNGEWHVRTAGSGITAGSISWEDRLFITNNGSVVVGSSSPTASAKLEVQSTTQGFLPPLHTTTNMNAVSSPATGLQLYNTTAGMNLSYNGSAFKSSGVVSGSYTATGTATTTFTVTFGGTQPNSTYKVNVTPSNSLSAALFYVNNKTTTTFDIVYLAGLTGAVALDWSLTQ